jgi:hypothetical protein
MRDTALARYVPDFRRDPFHRWLEKWHAIPLLVLSVVLAVWGAVREGAFSSATNSSATLRSSGYGTSGTAARPPDPLPWTVTGNYVPSVC